MNRLFLLPTRRLLLVLPFLAVFAGGAAALPPTQPQVLLRAATSPADLRGRLTAYAEGPGKADPLTSGEAWFFVGESYRRGGRPDSAITAFRRAVERRNSFEDRYALALALFDRQAPGDIDEGLKLAEASLAETRNESGRAAVRFQALLAWGKLLAGELPASRELFAGVEGDIVRDPEWRYRCGRAMLTAPDAREGIVLLRPLGVASRAQAQEVMQLLERAAQRYGQVEAMDRDLADQMKTRDAIEERVVTRMEARRIKFSTRDGFPLSGVLLEAPGAGRHRPAIVMMAPGDTIADFDSLAVALRGAGYHTLLLFPRGSGWSVAPSCPLPYAWRGREEAMLGVAARDARDAVRAVSQAAKCDTSAVVLVASRGLALAGATAAAQDARVRALVLLSPDPDPVDRGVTLATLARRPIPVFFQQTMEDYPNNEFVDAAYHTGAESISRVSDGHSGGHGAIAFKLDRRVTPRFTQWLTDALTAPATPRARPRKG